MDTMNVVLAADRDVDTGRVTHLLVGIADRTTRNWLSPPEVMSASYVARCIQTGQRFETFYIGEAGPDLTVSHLTGGAHSVVMADAPDALFTLDDLPPCGSQEMKHAYRAGRKVP